MKTRNYVIATLLAAFCVGYSGPSRSQNQAPKAYRQAPKAYRQAPKAYRQAPNSYDEWDPTPRGTPCGDNGLYSNGTGTCCSRIQTNPPSCQPPPLARRRY
jgi:hypothetical protein